MTNVACRDCGAPFEPEPTRIGRNSTTVRCPECRAERAECERAMRRDTDRPKNIKRCPICRKPILECLGNCMTPESAKADHVFMLAQPDKWDRAHRMQRIENDHKALS